MEGFAFIVFSALMHSLWNILLKKADNKYIFNYQMHIINLIIFTSLYTIIFPEYFYFDIKTVTISFIASIFFSLYHICISTAYRFEEASRVYPITVASPFFVMLWASIFLNEKISINGLLGILIIMIGVLVVNGFKSGFSKFSVGMIWAFIAAFFYSIGSVIDKVGVGQINFPLYVYSLTLFMTFFVFIFSLHKREDHWEHFKNNYKILMVAGLVIFLSFLSFRLGLIAVKVTYASALRQVSSLFGVIMGVLILRESFKINRILGAVLIMVGAIIIRLVL